MSITRNRIARLLGITTLLVAAVLLLLFLERFNLESTTIVLASLRNFGHLPLFGLLAVIVLWLLRFSFGKRIDIPIQYVIAWMGAVGIGALSEYMQISTQRDADIVDWLIDIAGVTSFLALHLTIDPWFVFRGNKLRIRHRIMLRFGAILIVSVSAIPLLISYSAQSYRNTIFPVLYTFDSYFEQRYLDTGNADLHLVAPPPGWRGCESKVAEIVFFPSKYPTVYCNGPFPDWDGYRVLTMDVFYPADDSLTLQVMIKDSLKAPYHDRYNGQVQVRPGYNRVEIPLSDIEQAPEDRRLDLSSIAEICLFLVDPEQEIILYLDNLLLE